MPPSSDAQAALRKCVHCGFCLATCPTYQLLGDELDSPRGRLYLMKQVFEGNAPTATTQQHLDRCLTCRACETTCPSGVEYHVVLDAGRARVDRQVPRPPVTRLLRLVLREVLPRRWLFDRLVAIGRFFRRVLPASLQRQLGPPPRRKPGPGLESGFRWHDKKYGVVLMLQGCVQPALRPDINAAARRVLERLGIGVIEAPGARCCGALRHHLDAQRDALEDAREAIDAWWPHVISGLEAIVITASGCGAHVADYGRLLRNDRDYADKAQRVSELARDLAEFIDARSGRLPVPPAGPAGTVAFQSPCTLQHGLRVRGAAERVLAAAGYELTPVADAHLCCGSAGTYSILQPKLSKRLRDDKLAALHAGAPQIIATANIGCLTHLAAGTATPVRHWIELLDERLAEPSA